MVLIRIRRYSGAAQATKELCLPTFLLTLHCLNTSQPIHAQSTYSPTNVWGMSSTFTEGQSMIVHGGTFTKQSQPVGQTFSLNLATSWNTSQPDFKQLADGFNDFKFVGALQTDNRTWFMVGNATAHRYDISNDIWRDLGYSSSANPARGLGAATNPVSGLIYIVNGYTTNGTISMQEFNPVTVKLGSLPMDPTLVNMESFAVVWSTVRNSMLVHGGMIKNSGNVLRGLYEYVVSDGKWNLLSDTGNVPTPRKSHCLVPAYGGTKMILFGGYDRTGVNQSDRALSDIYSLDVATLVWTKLIDPGSSYARANHVCAVTNDMFVSWGGGDSSYNPVSNSPTLVYNMKKNGWQNTYSSLPEPGDAVMPPTSSPSLVPLGAIVGGVAGAGALALSISLMVYCRKKHAQKPFLSLSGSGLAEEHRHGGEDSNGSRKHHFHSLASLDGTEAESGYALTKIGTQKDQHSHQQQPLLSTADKNPHSATKIAAGTESESSPRTLGETDLKRDQTIYKPHEIATISGRSPQSITSSVGYMDSINATRDPQTIVR